MEQVFIVTRTTVNKCGLVPYPEENNVILKAFICRSDAQDYITNMSNWNKTAMEEQLDDIWYDINAKMEREINREQKRIKKYNGSSINLEMVKKKYQSRLDRVDSDRIIYKEINDAKGELKSIRIEVEYFCWTREYLIIPMPVNQKNTVDLFPSGSVYDLDLLVMRRLTHH